MLKNLVFDAGIPLTDAVSAATINPARVIGVDDKLGSVEKGKLADLCIMDNNLDAKAVILNGRIIKDNM